jgi:hypothetical protein
MIVTLGHRRADAASTLAVGRDTVQKRIETLDFCEGDSAPEPSEGVSAGDPRRSFRVALERAPWPHTWTVTCRTDDVE